MSKEKAIELAELFRATAPAIMRRTELKKFGFPYAASSMANFELAGVGPAYVVAGGSATYTKDDLANWWISRIEKEKGDKNA
jgi:hypothetical protein